MLYFGQQLEDADKTAQSTLPLRKVAFKRPVGISQKCPLLAR